MIVILENSVNTDSGAGLESDEQWMRLALHQADKAEAVGEVPVGAVIVRENIVVASGHNQPITTRDPTAHAEVVAIRAAAQACDNYRLPDTTLYITIEPCAMCLGAIMHARIARVVFGATEPRAGCLQSHPALLEQQHFNHKVSITGGVLAAQCSQTMSAFFQKKRKGDKRS